jgi:hypothetical protein
MEDMLRALEKGSTTLTPRAKKKLYHKQGLKIGDKPVNGALAYRHELEERERRHNQEKKEKLEARNAYLKEKIR